MVNTQYGKMTAVGGSQCSIAVR
uniref:Uncharacterized protein n=1 Tax=Anguilla anguilla TaxID=7936 RepID=A0A0E9TX26_ANGAN